MQTASHVYNLAGNKETLDSLRRGEDSKKWTTGLANELGRLTQGVGINQQSNDKITGTNTIFFISCHQVPDNAKVTYVNFVCNLRPLK